MFRDDNDDGYGNKVVIDHGGQLYSVYAHLENSSWGPGIEVNEYVSAGQLLARAGDTGGDYPVHLHFHMMLGQNAYKPEPLSKITGFDQWGACATTIPSPYWISCSSTDLDCDGFIQSTETFIGTTEPGPCAMSSQSNNEPLPDRWPLDFDDNQLANIGDYLKFNPLMNSFAPGPPYQARFDLTPNGAINVGDLLNFNPYMNKHCKP